MASNATIFKATLHIADVDRHYYHDHEITLARHPSETDERMMVRLLAFVRHAHEALSFGRGLGVCPSHLSLRGEGDAARCEAAGSKIPEAYSLEYVEDVFGPRTTQMPADRLPQ